MYSIWDFSQGSMPSGYEFFDFLSWSSTQILGENSAIYDITFPQYTYSYYYYDDYSLIYDQTIDLEYVDRITYSSGTQQYSFLGTNLDATTTDTGWFDARIFGLTFNDSATGEKWVVSFENTDLILPEILDLYSDQGAAAVAMAFLGGDDIMGGRSGRDLINGFAGDDTVYAGSGADTILGGAGNDYLYGEAKADVLDGNAGDDYLSGGAGADTLRGGDGNDTIWGDWGVDVMIGGDGDDYISGDWRDHGERMYGGAGNDTIWGGYNADDLLIRGGAGADFLSLSYTYGDKSSRVFGDEGADTLTSYSGDDYLNGGTGFDRLRGNSGNDTLVGEDGNDRLFGGADNDRLKGGEGNDVLKGQDGRDVLIAGPGDDTLTGGAGRDTFVFEATDEGAFITDFVSGEDTLRFEGMAGLEDTLSYAVAVIDYEDGVPEGEYDEILYVMVGDLTLQFVGTGLSVIEADMVFT